MLRRDPFASIGGLELGKGQRTAARLGLARAPKAQVIAERLGRLREFRWSSYRAYAGYSLGVGWLWRQPLERLCGGRSQEEQRAALRAYTEQPVRQGVLERPWERLVAGLVLGSAAFAQSLQRRIRGDGREQPSVRGLARPVSWSRIVSVLEDLKGESWAQFSQRHGDWGRDAALWLGRKRARYSLRELGELAGGVDYAAVGQAVSRFSRRLAQQPQLRRSLTQIENELSNVET